MNTHDKKWDLLQNIHWKAEPFFFFGNSFIPFRISGEKLMFLARKGGEKIQNSKKQTHIREWKKGERKKNNNNSNVMEQWK